jgi:predicted nucleic acid-binding protein
MLLDASIIIHALRGKDLQLLGQMRLLGGAVCGITRAEVLSGARNAQDQMRLVTILDAFQQVAIPDALWDEVGFIQAQLRAGGVTVALVDAVLAAVALALDEEIWARDIDFQHVQRLFPTLKLYQEAA